MTTTIGAMSAKQIASEMIEYRQRHGNGVHGWYAGITGDPQTRLNAHNAQASDLPPLVRLAMSETDAREAEAMLLQAGFKGGTGGGTRPVYVYAYRIGLRTVEST